MYSIANGGSFCSDISFLTDPTFLDALKVIKKMRRRLNDISWDYYPLSGLENTLCEFGRPAYELFAAFFGDVCLNMPCDSRLLTPSIVIPQFFGLDPILKHLFVMSQGRIIDVGMVDLGAIHKDLCFCTNVDLLFSYYPKFTKVHSSYLVFRCHLIQERWKSFMCDSLSVRLKLSMKQWAHRGQVQGELSEVDNDIDLFCAAAFKVVQSVTMVLPSEERAFAQVLACIADDEIEAHELQTTYPPAAMQLA